MRNSNSNGYVEALKKRFPGCKVGYHYDFDEFQVVLNDGESFRHQDPTQLVRDIEAYQKAQKAEAEANNEGMIRFEALLAKAKERAIKAAEKFPQPNYVLNKFSEESGEVVKEIIHYTEGRGQWKRVEDEIVDLLAMTLRLLKEGDGVIGFVPPYLQPEVTEDD
ncbi:MazG-like family protein (plasmid) [Enterobacter hormaechei]|uniref:MazG-like family protein n=1 Tax=Enterobacter hormaechei TaxID=158836 RepID=UPI002B4BCDA5|nr:MazG-like family protein [Enterobacter hormaechei]WRM07129.1 MazG-like family protein [Enterobacter hormaechei]